MRRTFKYNPSAAYTALVRAAERLLATEGRDSVERACAEVLAPVLREGYRKGRGVTPSTSGHVCVSRLVGKRCGADCLTRALPGADHLSAWNKNRRLHTIVSQPYGLHYEAVQQLVAFCERYGLEAQINTSCSWHFPGQTLLVEVRKKGKA